MMCKMKVWLVLAALLGTMSFSSGTMQVLPGCDVRATLPEGWVYLMQDEAVAETYAENFGMTAEDALAFMEENHYYLYLYNQENHAQLYFAVIESEYAEQMGTIEKMSDEHRQVLYDLLLASYPGWTNDSGMSVYDAGKMTYLTTTMHCETGGKRTDDRQMFTYWGKYAVYIDLYVPQTGITEELVEMQNDFADNLVYDISQKQGTGKQQLIKAGTLAEIFSLWVIAVGLALVWYLRKRKLA